MVDLICRSTLMHNIEQLDEKIQKANSHLALVESHIQACSPCCSHTQSKCIEDHYISSCPNYEPKTEKLVKDSTLTACVCKNCGGHLNRTTMICDFCGTSYIWREPNPSVTPKVGIGW